MKVVFKVMTLVLIAIGIKAHEQKLLLIGNSKIVVVSFFNSSITTDVFKGWIEHALWPKLKEKSVLIMDNAIFHKGKRRQELVQKEGYCLVSLPNIAPT